MVYDVLSHLREQVYDSFRGGAPVPHAARKVQPTYHCRCSGASEEGEARRGPGLCFVMAEKAAVAVTVFCGGCAGQPFVEPACRGHRCGPTACLRGEKAGGYLAARQKRGRSSF